MNGCCGQPSRPRRLTPPKALPANPRVSKGVKLIYLGAGLRELHGSASGLMYTVADHRRDFVADPEDVKSLLRSRFVILRP